jgi:hypothetical protein
VRLSLAFHAAIHGLAAYEKLLNAEEYAYYGFRFYSPLTVFKTSRQS